ncbi:MAG: 50S ribosomal protein L24 [Candidatus Aminicenantes bacterium]|nr:50S ribosomal protein L24 [Candidatus Aminicenantes bacterium]
MQKYKLRKNDTVIVISGRRQDKKKTGKILRIVSEKNRVVVEKIHIIKEYVRANPQKNIKGGIVEREGAIPIEKVMYYCKECEQGVRIGFRVSDSGKQRICKKCGVVLD